MRLTASIMFLLACARPAPVTPAAQPWPPSRCLPHPDPPACLVVTRNDAEAIRRVIAEEVARRVRDDAAWEVARTRAAQPNTEALIGGFYVVHAFPHPIYGSVLRLATVLADGRSQRVGEVMVARTPAGWSVLDAGVRTVRAPRTW